MAKRAPIVPSAAPKTTAVAKNKKPGPVVLTGYEKLVDVLIEKNSEITAAEKVIDHSRKDLDPIVTAFRTNREKEGEFTKTIHVNGSEMNGVYTFKDSYAKIDTAVEKDLKLLLGAEYDVLFTREEDISVKPNSMEKLLELAKKHNFLDLLEKDEYLKPVSDFRQKRHERRGQMTPEQNKALDEVVQQVAAKPSLSYK